MAVRVKELTVYGVALNDTVYFQPFKYCDQYFLLYPLLSGVVTSDSVISYLFVSVLC